MSVEPVIDPVQALRLIEELNPWVDGWKVGKLNHHPLARETDWYGFAAEVERLLQLSGKEYLIKESLRPYVALRNAADTGLDDNRGNLQLDFGLIEPTPALPRQVASGQ